jgi:hypothetical protein
MEDIFLVESETGIAGVENTCMHTVEVVSLLALVIDASKELCFEPLAICDVEDDICIVAKVAKDIHHHTTSSQSADHC